MQIGALSSSLDARMDHLLTFYLGTQSNLVHPSPRPCWTSMSEPRAASPRPLPNLNGPESKGCAVPCSPSGIDRATGNSSGLVAYLDRQATSATWSNREGTTATCYSSTGMEEDDLFRLHKEQTEPEAEDLGKAMALIGTLLQQKPSSAGAANGRPSTDGKNSEWV